MFKTIDTIEQEVITANKSILKRRIRNVRSVEELVATSSQKFNNDHNNKTCAEGPNASKRNVTFNEMVTVKNEKDLIVKKPLKLQIIIENWKSRNTPSPGIIIQPNPGIVRRLVDEFTTNPLIDSKLFEEEKLKRINEENNNLMEIQKDILQLEESLETKAMSSKVPEDDNTLNNNNLPDNFRNIGRVNDLINMFNSKSTINKTEEFRFIKMTNF